MRKKIISIVGRTGSGKTTLCNSIKNKYDSKVNVISISGRLKNKYQNDLNKIKSGILLQDTKVISLLKSKDFNKKYILIDNYPLSIKSLFRLLIKVKQLIKSKFEYKIITLIRKSSYNINPSPFFIKNRDASYRKKTIPLIRKFHLSPTRTRVFFK